MKHQQATLHFGQPLLERFMTSVRLLLAEIRRLNSCKQNQLNKNNEPHAIQIIKKIRNIA